MDPRQARAHKKEDKVPGTGGVENVYAIFNDTLVHVTDMSGHQAVARVSGIFKMKGKQDEVPPCDAIAAAQEAGEICKTYEIRSLRIKTSGYGGPIGCQKTNHSSCDPGCALRNLSRTSRNTYYIEYVIPVNSDCPRRTGGRRGRQL